MIPEGKDQSLLTSLLPNPQALSMDFSGGKNEKYL